MRCVCWPAVCSRATFEQLRIQCSKIGVVEVCVEKGGWLCGQLTYGARKYGDHLSSSKCLANGVAAWEGIDMRAFGAADSVLPLCQQADVCTNDSQRPCASYTL